MTKSKKTTNNKATASKSKPTAKKVSKPAAKAKPVAKKATKTIAKKVAKPAPKNTAKPVAKKVAKPAPKKATKPVAKKAAKPIAKKATTKKAIKAAPNKAAKPIVKKAVKAAPPKAAKPVIKKAAKPAPKKTAKPITKKAVKPAPKKAVKPVSKPVSKPTPKKVIAPAKKVAPAVKQSAKTEAKQVVAPKTITKPQPKAVAPTKQVSAPSPVVDKMMEKKVNTKKPTHKKGSKPIETYDGKRIVRSELPAKALITIQKPEEEVHMETNHYEFPTLRYSDAELKEFKDLIDNKLASQREELKNLKDSLESHTESQVGNKSWNMEEGSDTSEMEYLMNQIARLNKFIRDLEMALVRIENKTYGICRATGKLIDKNRLRIVPHATLSIEAKMSRKTDDIPNNSQAPSAHMGSEGEGFGTED